ncbi:MAG: hypothetical protein QG561_661, partial [Patescibacteria group bacterium]|nr:hypothetical protein [Patescibacteria group bacterium]
SIEYSFSFLAAFIIHSEWLVLMNNSKNKLICIEVYEYLISSRNKSVFDGGIF